jgi:hypothetical protein
MRIARLLFLTYLGLISLGLVYFAVVGLAGR